MMPRDHTCASGNIVTNRSSSQDKIQFYKELFKGRTDRYAIRWEAENGRHGYAPARDHVNHLLPLEDQALFDHLSGRKTIGIYPLINGNLCSFLAVDFDKGKWQKDVLAFAATCERLKVPCSIERSRSGDGAHVWIFFTKAIVAATARKLGAALLKKTKEQHDLFGLPSFDRLFPNQDAILHEGFGNLIALPLQKIPRQNGNSVFVDKQFRPYPDQWMFLSTVLKMTEQDIEAAILRGNDPFIYEGTDLQALPKTINVQLKNGIHIPKEGMPSSLLSEIMDLVSFNNPGFYKAQAKRFSTQGIPRKIHCAEDHERVLVLPRGCLEEFTSFLEQKSIEIALENNQWEGEKIAADFHGTLSMQQAEAVKVLKETEHGTLSATTGFGKTVVASAIIAERKINTLIIVHRTQLMKQWVEQLSTFLGVSPEEIGQIGGGKQKITGKIDVATIQSLNYGGRLKSFIAQYGQVIVDECHIISAVTFEKVLRQIRPRYVLGLTATPKRKDGMDPIIRMQCGPIRYTVDAKSQAQVRPFRHRLVERKTNFRTNKTSFHDIYADLAVNSKRNEQIFNDVLGCLEEGRSPIILTERLEHLEILKEQFRGFVKNIVVLAGNMGKKDRKRELERLVSIGEDEERLVIATGKYIGEGFDDARLDTLFLTMPISWKGTLQQYVGRLHRYYDSKQEVRVYDYVDHQVPMLQTMYEKRIVGYKSMGYQLEDGAQTSEQMRLF
nr:DEAD/DEAH box helicase [Sporosarcina sp. HYO08]